MINVLSQNYCKPNEYNYYHIRIVQGEEVLMRKFDLSLEETIAIIKTITSPATYTVIGTVETAESCISFINGCYADDSIVSNFVKKDIFDSINSVFVNCTEYFRRIVQ